LRLHGFTYHFFVLLFCAALASCSGGSSNKNSVKSDSATRPNPGGNNDSDSRELPKVEIFDLSTSAITSDNLETIISHVYRFTRYRMHKFSYQLDNVDLEKGDNASPSNHSDVQANLDSDCVRGGKFYLEIVAGPSPVQDEQGYRIYSHGSSLSQTFSNCGGRHLNAPFEISGYGKTEVLSGLWDGFRIVSENTELKMIQEHHVIKASYAGNTNENYDEYGHGTTFLSLVGSSELRLGGDMYAEKDHDNPYYRHAYQIHDFDFRMNKISGRWGWDDEYELSEYGGFSFDILKESLSVDIEISEALLYRNVIEEFASGGLVVTGLNSSALLTFTESYIEYRLDSNNDGDFETQSIVMISAL